MRTGLPSLSVVAAIRVLPRQFQVLVVENVNEEHVGKAAWLFPPYLLIINLFVLPIAMAGILRFGAHKVDPDIFVLMPPMAAHHELLSILVYLGGLFLLPYGLRRHYRLVHDDL